MANPYASNAKNSSSAKAKSIIGKKSGGAVFSGEKSTYATGGRAPAEFKVGGTVSAPRADRYARGGKAKGKKGTTINIAVIGGGKDAGAEAPGMPPPMPKPPMAPPPGMGPPGGGMPPGMPPMQRGGSVKMKAGAETGPGRLQKAKAYKRG